MNWYYVVIGIIILYYLYSSSNSSSDSSSESYCDLTHIYYFYSDSCPHCVDMKPHYEKVKNSMGSDYEFHEIDMKAPNDKDKGLIKKHGVTKMPTLIKVNPKETSTYQGEKSFEKIKSWVKSN